MVLSPMQHDCSIRIGYYMHGDSVTVQSIPYLIDLDIVKKCIFNNLI